MVMRWHESWRADPRAREIYDRHYSRRASSVGKKQFVAPSRNVVLVIPSSAMWVTIWQEHVEHAWPGAWLCSAFRNERPDLYRSSELVLEALAATRFELGDPPPAGMVTFVDEDKTRRKRDPGRCFRRAGFHVSGSMPCCAGKPERTIDRDLLALHIAPEAMPPAVRSLRAQGDLFGGLDASKFDR